MSIPFTKKEAKFDSARKNHIIEAVKNYAESAKLAPKNSLAFLGPGWVLEQEDTLGKAADVCPIGGAKSNWKKEALKAYRTTYKLSVDEELAQKSSYAGSLQISRESGEGILRLMKARPLSTEEGAESLRIKATLEAFRKKPPWVTPIIFPSESPSSLAQLLDKRKLVNFDLVGDGVKRQWSWLRPDTGILIWDPKQKGQIVSGRQLFGSATWRMFWRDGYEAMSALDDNHDGWLTGRELTGLGVWRDANGNGKSDPGEAVPVGRMGIVRLAVHPQGKREGALFHENGVVLKSGKSLPTYDWTPKSEAVIVVRGNSVFTLKKGRRSDRVYGRLSSVSSGQISDRKLVGH